MTGPLGNWALWEVIKSLKVYLWRRLWDPHFFLLLLGLWGKTFLSYTCAMKCSLSWDQKYEVNHSWARTSKTRSQKSLFFVNDSVYFTIVYLYRPVPSLNLPRSEDIVYLLPTSLLFCLLVALAHRTVCLCPFMTLFPECSFSTWEPVLATHLLSGNVPALSHLFTHALFSISWSTGDILTFYICYFFLSRT